MLLDHEDLISASAGEENARLFDIARQIRVWQESQVPKMSDNALMQRYPALGSTKTFKRLREGDAAQLKVDEWLSAYEGVLTQVLAATGETKEEIYADLSFAAEIYRDVLQLVQVNGLNRLIIIEGDSGAGKTESLKLVEKQLAGGVVYADADESWARPAVMVGQLCLASGAVNKLSDLPQSLAERLDMLVTHLQARRVVLIDEGHHLSGQSINLLKSLINRTPSVFVIAALSTLWKKLQANAWQEAKQLIFNRLFSRIRLTGPTVDDATKFLGRRLTLDGETSKAIKTVTEVAAQHGGMAFLRGVVNRVRKLGSSQHADGNTLLEAAAYVKRQVEGRA